MDRIIYLGPYNNNKKEEFFQQSIDYLKKNKGDRFYYILPNGNLLTKYRKAMIERVEKTFDINLFTFDDIADKLIEDNFYTYIDRDMKEAILIHILLELRENGRLKYYKEISNKKGFIKMVSNVIGEIKRSLIIPEIYLSKCPDHPFYKEIGMIYNEYESWLDESGFIDREGSFFKSLEILKEDNSFFNGLDFIFVDEFFDFRPQEMELLKEITKTQIPIYINMPFYRGENFSTLNNTLTILEELGFKIEFIEKESQNYYEKMASEIFTSSDTRLEPNPNIKLVKANNGYLELKKVAEEIKYHYNQGARLEDMAVVLANPDEYKRILLQVFEEEKIPSTISRDINLIEIPFIKELIYILELKVNNMDKKATINRIKSNYFSLCKREEREAIEYILRKTHFNTLEDIKNSNQLLASTYGDIIEETIIKIQEELELIPEIAFMEEYIELLQTLLDRHSIEEKTLSIYGRVQDYNLLYRDLMGIEKLKTLIKNLENLTKIFPKEIPLEDFLNLLENYLQNESIVEIQGNSKGVNILTPVTTRGQAYKVLFIVGLSQGKYPNIMDENFFLREKNNKELKRIGIDYKNYHEKLDKESLVFSTVVSACTHYLYLTYSENSTGEEKDIPSIFLDEIIQRVEGDKTDEKLKITNVDIDYLIKNDPKQLTTKDEIIKYSLRNYYEREFSSEVLPIPSSIEDHFFSEVNNRLMCQLERNEEDFNQYSGNIGEPHIITDIRNIHRDKAYSISYLESYGKCPYFFLLNNVLNVEEMERELIDFSPLDRGVIIHEVLREYYYNYRNGIKDHVLGVEIFNVDETYDYIVEKINTNMKSLDLETETNLWKLRIENNANNILNLIKSDLDRMAKYKKKILPLYFEMDFGRKSPFFIEIEGHKIPLRGKIDRIDKYVDEDKYIIIDYKNTGYSIRDIEDVEIGLSLQLPVYIMSQEDKNVVAAMYGIVSKGEFDLKIVNVEEKHLVGRKRKGVVNEKELEELLNQTKVSIKEYIDSIYSGDFSVNPVECSPFCVYKDICRYESKLEVLP